MAAAYYEHGMAAHGGEWRATPDNDEHYIYAVALL